MKSYRVYGLNGCKMILDDRTGRFKVLFIDVVDDLFSKEFVRFHDLSKIKKYNKNDFKKKYVNNRSQGIVVGFSARFEDPFDFRNINKKDYSIVVLDGINDPQNLGQIIRTCECAGVDSIVLPENRSVSMTDSVIQISQGSFTNINISTEKNINRFIDNTKKEGFWVTGFENSVSASKWYELDMSGRVVFIFGSEGSGVRSLTLKKCDFIGTIPMIGKVNSLNVSASVSAILFERMRQIDIKSS